MSIQPLLDEHAELNELVDSWGSSPQINDFDIQVVKRRRCNLKTEAMNRASNGNLEAIVYADTRQWEYASAA